jgi:hypothetical protein
VSSGTDLAECPTCGGGELPLPPCTSIRPPAWPDLLCLAHLRPCLATPGRAVAPPETRLGNACQMRHGSLAGEGEEERECGQSNDDILGEDPARETAWQPVSSEAGERVEQNNQRQRVLERGC